MKNQEPPAIDKLVSIKFVFSISPSRSKTEWIGTLMGFKTSLSRSYTRKTYFYIHGRRAVAGVRPVVVLKKCTTEHGCTTKILILIV